MHGTSRIHDLHVSVQGLGGAEFRLTDIYNILGRKIQHHTIRISIDLVET
jgi:hypothetical protein